MKQLRYGLKTSAARPWLTIRGSGLLAAVEELSLLLVGQTVVSAAAHLVEYAVNLVLLGLLAGIIVPVRLASRILITARFVSPTVTASLPVILHAVKELLTA